MYINRLFNIMVDTAAGRILVNVRFLFILVSSWNQILEVIALFCTDIFPQTVFADRITTAYRKEHEHMRPPSVLRILKTLLNSLYRYFLLPNGIENIEV